MSAAKEARDIKRCRVQADMETALRNGGNGMTAIDAYEVEHSRANALAVNLDIVLNELEEVRQALKVEEKARRRLEEAVRCSREDNSSLRLAYSNALATIGSRVPLTKYEAMLLVCDDGGFVLVHPGLGGLESFKTLSDACAWASAHDGFIPQAQSHHSLHGNYYRVGFNKWPNKEETK